jgi:hypothetical protein
MTIGTTCHNCTSTYLELNLGLRSQKPITIAADTPIEANSEMYVCQTRDPGSEVKASLHNKWKRHWSHTLSPLRVALFFAWCERKLKKQLE